MRLSEAIRLGAMLKPQMFGGNKRVVPVGILGLRDETVATCAMTAAYEAAGCRFVPCGPTPSQYASRAGMAMMSVEVPPEWPVLIGTMCPVANPCPVLATANLHQIIAHLNDDHRWTREQIADWVESIERQQEQQPVDVQSVPVTA